MIKPAAYDAQRKTNVPPRAKTSERTSWRWPSGALGSTGADAGSAWSAEDREGLVWTTGWVDEVVQQPAPSGDGGGILGPSCGPPQVPDQPEPYDRGVRTHFALVSCAAMLAASASVAHAEPREFTIGVSQAGSPLEVYALGAGPKRVLILGGQHGGPEANTVALVNGLLDYFADNPNEVPRNVELDVLLAANPDGLAVGSRQFTSGVDPNRNWGGSDWRSDAFDSNAIFRIGLGGSEPFSEQETRALADWILKNKPALTVNYHSAGGFMFGPRGGAAGDIATAYADASGYWWPGGAAPGGGGNRSPLPYQASGSMNRWLGENGFAGILIELSTPRDTEIERNLAGLKAALDVLSAQ